jgi:hypothetical protein
LTPAWISVSTSAVEETFHGPSIHVHAAVSPAGCVVTVASPHTILNVEAFTAALAERLSAPNSFD